jgi:hypothetical protein
MGNGEAFIWLSWVGPLIVCEMLLQWPEGPERRGCPLALMNPRHQSRLSANGRFGSKADASTERLRPFRTEASFVPRSRLPHVGVARPVQSSWPRSLSVAVAHCGSPSPLTRGDRPPRGLGSPRRCPPAASIESSWLATAAEPSSYSHLRQSGALRNGDLGVCDQQGIGVSQLAMHDTRALASRIIGQEVGHLWRW